jgi:hypothetical protein
MSLLDIPIGSCYAFSSSCCRQEHFATHCDQCIVVELVLARKGAFILCLRHRWKDSDIGGGSLDVLMTCPTRESSLLVTEEASLTVACSRLHLLEIRYRVRMAYIVGC